MSSTVVVAGMLTQASPIQGMWDIDVSLNFPFYHKGRQYVTRFLYAFSAISIAQDLALAVMPAVILWNLHKKPAERMRLMLLLGLGASAAVAVLVRIFFLMDRPYKRFGKPPIFICSIVEMGIAIIAGSLAPLRMAMKGWWKNITGREWQRMRAQAQSPLQGIELMASSGTVIGSRKNPVRRGGWI